MLKKIVYIAILLLASQQIMAQGKAKIKKADKFHEGYSYSKAIEKYEGITEKTPAILRNLADSYFRTREYDKSETYYAQLCTLDEATAEDVYNYAYVLKMNEKYSESQRWMAKFKDLKSDDSRAKALTSDANYYTKLQKDKGQFTISNLDINTEQEDFGTAFYKGNIVFASSREGIVPVKRRWNWNKLPFLNLYEAQRNEDNSLKTPRKFVRRLNKKFHEGPASFNEAGDFVVFTRNNYKGKSKDGVIKLQLFTSQLEGNSWSKPKAVPFNSPEYSVGHPALSPDGLTMYFASDMPGGQGGVDLYIVKRSKEGVWESPQNLGNLVNTEGNEMFPYISNTGELLFFASDGQPGLGGLDVFVAKVENNVPQEFKNVGVPVNTSKDDFAFILDKEGKGGYFSSNRPGGKGDDDIYAYILHKPFLFNKVIKGTAKDTDGNLLANTEVNLYDEKGKIIETITTDATGAYTFKADNDKKYSLKGIKE